MVVNLNSNAYEPSAVGQGDQSKPHASFLRQAMASQNQMALVG